MEEVISKNKLIQDKFKLLGLDCPIELIAQWTIKEKITDKNYDTVLSLLDCIKMLRESNRCKLIKSMSRLPQVAQRTFDNFDISRISAMNKEMLEHLRSLSFLDTGSNIVIVGDPGTGKTHLAQAIGNLCCEKLYTTRYYKMVELKENLKKAIDRIKPILC